MTATKTRQYDAIASHGRDLLAIFPAATERDPVKLCKKLRRLESVASAIGLQLCNGPEMAEDEQEHRIAAVLAKVNTLLHFSAAGIPVFVNLDPRGYAIKIDSEWMDAQRADSRTAYKAAIDRDWGGYGILAPTID